MDFQAQFNQWLECRAKQVCHRQLLVISGPENWATEQAEQVIEGCQYLSVLWAGHGGEGHTQIAASHYRQFLGQEFPALVYNCYSGLRANAVLALSGTIQSRGLMILLCPDFNQWPTFVDPQNEQRISFGYQNRLKQSYFIRHLLTQVTKDKHVAVLTERTFRSGPPAAPHSSQLASLNCQSEEQSLAIQAIIKTALGHRRRPYVLSADRGRGKSSALGIAAASLIKNHHKDIVITAPTVKTVEQVFKHARVLLPEATFDGKTLTTEHGRLRFIPADDLLKHGLTTDMVMIDEAAALPTPILKKIHKKHSRLVFSTTLHGYEGSGRGFELRFKKYLDEVNSNWKSLHLSQPIRWYQGDVLEQFWFTTMLMDKPVEKCTLGHAHKAQCDVTALSSTQLMANPDLLIKVFQLLVNAHYQTSPDDLLRLLDAPEQQVFVLRQSDSLLGVALVVEEGGTSLSEVAQDIACGSRRVKGHLVAQNLAFHTGIQALCGIPQWRIVRIVIEPEIQGQGLGKLLIAKIEKKARAQNIELLSSAFGATSFLVNFWKKNQFDPVKLGLKRDAASGEHSVIVLKGLSPKASALTITLKKAFQKELLFHSSRQFKYSSSRILLSLLVNQAHDEALSDNDISIIQQFINHQRPLASCEHTLYKLLLQCMENYSNSLQEDYIFLLSLLMQNKNSELLCTEFKLIGKNHIQDKARLAIRKIFKDRRVTIKKLPK
ncbi:MAG: tRNA(Met) cytidine acetyltransferase [Paraglaciecola sp.]